MTDSPSLVIVSTAWSDFVEGEISFVLFQLTGAEY